MSNRTLSVATLTILTLGALAGTVGVVSARNYRHSERTTYNQNYRSNYRSTATVPAGTTFGVRLDTKLSTDDNPRGTVWNGTVTNDVYGGNTLVIPAGSSVTGVVTSSVQGTHSTRPSMDLSVTRVETVNGTVALRADTDPIVAGTTRAKKLGAIAGGAALGALLGHTVAKDSHGTLIGGIVGGAAGYGLTRHAMRTMQLKEGTVVTFVTREDMLARR